MISMDKIIQSLNASLHEISEEVSLWKFDFMI